MVNKKARTLTNDEFDDEENTITKMHTIVDDSLH